MTADEPKASQAELTAVAEALGSLDAATATRTAAEQAEVQARDSVYEAVRRLADRIEPAARIAVARRLYWDRLDLHVKPLALALGFANEYELRQIVGTWATGQACAGCGSELRKTARTSRVGHNVPEFAREICDVCWDDVRQGRWHTWESARAVERTIAGTVVEGPPAWWRVMTKLVLANPPITADIDDDYDHGYAQHRVWEAFTTARAIVDHGTWTVTAHEALILLRGAEAVAAWHPAEADDVVESEVGSTVFSAIVIQVEKAVEAARDRALQLLRDAEAGDGEDGALVGVQTESPDT